MTQQDKQRIDEMLQTYFPDEYYQEQREATIPLVAELLKEEKNKSIDECVKELLRAIYHGERELRITYERHTTYKGGSSLWLMQEMLEKYKSFLDKGKSQ